jgi:NAD(P)-dependent dehydrogenase (short-subunit alcohol dehydrogenase family)
MRAVEGKVAVVTGGASGIGLAMAQRFGQAGMQVVVADVLPDRIDEAVKRLRDEGLEVSGVVTDVTKTESVQALAERTLELYGGVHVVCNNAGVGSGAEGFVWEHELNDWRWAMDVNVWGVIHGIRTFVPIMLAQGDEGHVVNTSSSNGGLVPMGDTPVYALTKVAVVSLTEGLYAHLRAAEAPIGASVLFPGPGWLRTNLWDAWKTRPHEYAKERPRKTPYPSLEGLEEMMEKAGVEMKYTPLEEIAERVLQGILADQFWLLAPEEAWDKSVQARADSIINRTKPDYFRDWKP